MRKNYGLFKSVKALTLAAMLVAMSVVIGIFCKSVLNFGGGLFRITFENFPIILSGILFGPVAGGVVGAASDLISYLLSGQSYPPNVIVTLGAATIGIISGIVAKYVIKKRGTAQIITAGALSHLLGSMIIKPIGLFTFYSWAVLWRIPLYLVIMPMEILVLCLLFKNSTFKHLTDNIGLLTKENKMTYDEALEYIHGISWTFCKPGLDRTAQLCHLIGNPEKKLKFIHVAGTNGKGSFCSMLSSVLTAAGYKVGLYTSPYILKFNERMRVGGENISDEQLAQITAFVKPYADSMKDKPTEFELITAIGFEYFKRMGVDIVVLEAGMGGRLDSTNVIDTPVLSVITGVALDHTAFLGDTVQKIAYEKAGIIKHGTPVIYGGEDKDAQAVIKAVCADRNVQMINVDYSSLSIKKADLTGAVLDYKDYSDIKINLVGLYQPRNCAVVLEAINALKLQGYIINDDAVRNGLLCALWPARFEILSRDPLIIFDGAHNPEGIRSAVESIKIYFGEKKVYALTGVLRDKDYKTIAGELARVVSTAFTITPENPRALSAEDYAEELRGNGVTATPCASVDEAVKYAVKQAKEASCALICMGSLYTYGDIIKALNKEL